MRGVRVICVPSGLGAAEPGLEAGPQALLETLGLPDLRFRPDRGRAPKLVSPAPSSQLPAPAKWPVDWIWAPETDGSAADEYAVRYRLTRIHRLAERLRARVEAAVRRGELPVVLGGDHTTALGAFSGLRRARPELNLGIVWLDAHPDLNTPATTPSHNAHGMALAALLGYGHPLLASVGGPEPKLRPGQVILVGARSFDPGEVEFLTRHPEILLISADQWQRDPAAATRRVLDRVARLDGIHLSFDLDVVDPREAPGVATPVLEGPKAEEMQSLVRALLETDKVLGTEVVEYLPARDPDRRTARFAAALVRAIAQSAAQAPNHVTHAA